MERQIVQKLPFFQTVIGFLGEHPQKKQHLLIFIKLAQENPRYCNSPQLQEHEELRQKRLHMQSLWMWGKHLGICFKEWSIKKNTTIFRGWGLHFYMEWGCLFILITISGMRYRLQATFAGINTCVYTNTVKKKNTTPTVLIYWNPSHP